MSVIIINVIVLAAITVRLDTVISKEQAQTFSNVTYYAMTSMALGLLGEIVQMIFTYLGIEHLMTLYLLQGGASLFAIPGIIFVIDKILTDTHNKKDPFDY